MTNNSLKDVLRASTSLFTIKNLVRTVSGMVLLVLFSFAILLQYHTTKTSHQKQMASALPSLQDMERQTVSYIEGEEATVSTMNEEEYTGPLHQNQQVFVLTKSERVSDITMEEKELKDIKKYLKGERMLMRTVTFHAGSNVLMKNSEPELQKLLEMLKQNPKLKVKILGHTDNNFSGKIKKVKENDVPGLFNPENCRLTSGNSRKLSVLRVKVIESYLVKNGISGKRITTKGWGGKKRDQKKEDLKLDDSFVVEVEMLT